MKIRIFTTGGTIDKVYFDKESRYEVGPSGIKSILDVLDVDFKYDIQPILKKDSLDLTDKDRKLIVKKVRSDKHERIIITHGTSTMIKTAKLLEDIPGKVIVLTGSIEPALFKDTDAVFNIGCAVTAVQLLSHGVYIVMNGRVFNPHHVRKNTGTQRFEEVE
jgi:L-asparaginase